MCSAQWFTLECNLPILNVTLKSYHTTSEKRPIDISMGSKYLKDMPMFWDEKHQVGFKRTTAGRWHSYFNVCGKFLGRVKYPSFTRPGTTFYGAGEGEGILLRIRR